MPLISPRKQEKQYEKIDKLEGARIVKVERADDADEGLIIYLDNGEILKFGFSGCEGDFVITPDESNE